MNIKGIAKSIKSESAIISTFFSLLLIGIYCWKYNETKSTNEFGLNFFTEILGAAITVLVLERLIKKREENKLIPQKTAQYIDVLSFTSKYVHFWIETYSESVPDDFPETEQLFFSQDGMTKIFCYLHLNAHPNIEPPITWWEYISYSFNDLKISGDTVLNRHSNDLAPEVYGNIHHLIEGMFCSKMIALSKLKNYYDSNSLPTINFFNQPNFFTPQNNDYEAILGLIQWCNYTYERLRKENPTLPHLEKYNPNKLRELPPRSMYTQEIYKYEETECNVFNQQNN